MFEPEQRGVQRGGQGQEGKDNVGCQMDGALELDAPRLGRAPEAAQHLKGGLGGAPGPAELLGAQGVEVHRQLGGRLDVEEEAELPAVELGAIAQVQVFGERVALPAASVVDALASPHPGGAVEIHEASGPVTHVLLDGKMGVEAESLDPRQERVVGVEVAPAGLHHPDPRILEVGDEPLEEIRRGQEVGVEDRDEVALGQLQAVLQGAGFVALAVGAADVDDVEAALLPVANAPHSQGRRLVGRDVEHLDVEAVAGIDQPGARIDEPLDDERFVVERQLDRHMRPRRLRRGRGVGIRHGAGPQAILPGIGHGQPQQVHPVGQQHGHRHRVEDGYHRRKGEEVRGKRVLERFSVSMAYIHLKTALDS